MWTPIEWIEVSAAVVFFPHRALDWNAASEMPQRWMPVWGVRVAVLAITDKNSK